MKLLSVVAVVLLMTGCGQTVHYPNSKIYVCNDMGTIRYEEFGPDPIQGPVDPGNHPCDQSDFDTVNTNGAHWHYDKRCRDWVNGNGDCISSVMR